MSEVAPALMHLAWESVAALAIAPLQDLLNLGNEARMNVPGRAEDNWRWRCTEEMLSTRAFDWMRDLTNMSGRSPSQQTWHGRDENLNTAQEALSHRARCNGAASLGRYTGEMEASSASPAQFHEAHDD